MAQIFQRLPADDRLRNPHPVPRTTQLSLEVRELQASVSPTPFVVDSGVDSAIASQILRCANLHPKSPYGRDVFDGLGAYCSEASYFFFFAATLRFAGAFFFAAVFAFVAFFTILPSWPKPSGGVSCQHLRESQALHLDYYKRKEKKIFHVKETCMRRPRARPQGCAFPLLSA